MREEFKAYIQYALDERKQLPANLNEEDWQDFFQFCYSHSILGVVFAGIERADRPIPQQVLLEWFSFVESTKQQNAVVNKRLIAVSKWFEERGLKSVILKGQANGIMYPSQELRSPGDIDIWVDCEKMKLIKLVTGQCPGVEYSIHHIKMPVFMDVSVEVHYRPIYLINWFMDRRLQRYVSRIEKKQFENRVNLDGVEIGSLTNDFNVVYQLLHMYAHFFSTRNNFKQFVDYYYLLKQGLTEEQKKDAAALLKELKVLKYGHGMMWVMKEVLGLDEKLLVVEPDENVGKAIMRESMHYGKFSTNKIRYVIERFVANFRLALLFPGQVLISPLFLIWHQWWKVKMKMELRKANC
ncbi:MAG: nucleotidyltransferase family protein [Prevotella sp.]|nr:nucleotidyltransferase family protein [Prevotella sp.]